MIVPRSGIAVVIAIQQERQSQAIQLRKMRFEGKRPADMPMWAWLAGRRIALQLFHRRHPRPYRLRARDLRELAERYEAAAASPWVEPMRPTGKERIAEEGSRKLALICAAELRAAYQVLIEKGRGRVLARGR